MKVRVIPFGVLKERLSEAEVELPQGATIARLLEEIGRKLPAACLQGIAVGVNAEYATASHVLREGDEVGLLPPVSGGSDAGARNASELVQSPDYAGQGYASQGYASRGYASRGYASQATQAGAAQGALSFSRFLRIGWAAAILAVFFFSVSCLPAQETTFHVDSRLVNVFVNVTDHNGAIVGGLTREDFSLSEDGRPQTISLFERQSELPLALTLAIDTSGSVRKDMSEETAAARRFAHAILRPQDQMSVMQFATDVSVLTPFTNKISAIDRGLGQLHGDWASAVYDAICQGSEKLGPKEGRKVLVVVSDGEDTAQNSTYAQAVEAALRNEVMIYSIIDVPIEASAGRATGGEHALITMSEQTGGKHFYVTAGGLDKAFAQVSDDLRTQYLIGYYPKNQEPGLDFHRIQVTIPRAAADAFNIRHRTGYYAESLPRGE